MKKCIDKNCLEGLRSLHRDRFDFQTNRLMELNNKESEAKLRHHNNRYTRPFAGSNQKGIRDNNSSNSSRNVQNFINDISSTSTAIYRKRSENERKKEMQRSGQSGMIGDISYQPLTLGKVISNESDSNNYTKTKIVWKTPFGSRDDSKDGYIEMMNKRDVFRNKKNNKNKKKKKKGTRLPPLVSNQHENEEERKEESPVKHQVAETAEEAQKRFENIFADLVSS